MKIWISNKNKKLACDFAPCALLRDNIQHHIEAGGQSDKFSCIHALADTVWNEEETTLPAAPLREELKTAWKTLEHLRMADLAISLRTRAALEGFSEPPDVSGTVLHCVTSWPLPMDLGWRNTLGELLHTVVFDLFIHALHPFDDGTVRVVHAQSLGLVAPWDDEESQVRDAPGARWKRPLDS